MLFDKILIGLMLLIDIETSLNYLCGNCDKFN